MRTQRILPWLACLICFGTTSNSTRGADRALAEGHWPHWRGPHANGLVTRGNPPLTWSEEKNIKWKVAIPGKGHATPAIWEDRIFVMTAVGETPRPQAALGLNVAAQAQSPPEGRPGQQDGERRRRGGFGGRGGQAPTTPEAFTVLCLDRKTGQVMWEKVARKEVPHQGVQGSNTYCSGSPVTDGEHVFASFGSYGLYCYKADGTLVWEKDLGKVSVTFGEGSSPALHGNVLLVLQDNNGDSFLYAFDKATGKELWKKSRDEGSGWTTPTILEHGGKVQVLVSGSKAVRSYDLATGEELWQCAGLGSNPVPMIVTDEATAYAMSGHRQPAAIAIALGKSGDLTGTDAVRWSTTRGTPYVPSPLLYDGLLFFFQRNDALLTCLDAATGKPHYEQARLEGAGGFYSSPIGVNNRIYMASQNGMTLVLEKSKDLKILASNKLEDGFDASPALVGNELYLRGRANLYCIAEN